MKIRKVVGTRKVSKDLIYTRISQIKNQIVNYVFEAQFHLISFLFAGFNAGKLILNVFAFMFIQFTRALDLTVDLFITVFN